MHPPSPLHTSPDDWAKTMFCLIDPTHVITPPTSLSFQDGASCAVWLSHPLGDCVPYGRLTTALYCVPATPTWYPRTSIGFRIGYSFFWPGDSEHYTLFIFHDATDPPGADHIQLYRGNEFDTLLASWPFPPPLNAWHWWRITFIPDCTQPQPKPLLISVEHGSPGSWILLGSVSDPTDSWKDRDQNTIGFYLQDDQHWIDETTLEQYIPPPT